MPPWCWSSRTRWCDFTHLVVYLVAAGNDRELRSVILAMFVVCVALLALLAVGARPARRRRSGGGWPPSWSTRSACT